MKKILVASILGIVATASQSKAQGVINFDSYACDNGAGAIATYGSNTGQSGPIGGFTAALYYSLGDATDSGNNANLVGGGLTLLTQAASGQATYPTAIGGGYFSGPAVTIPGFTSGDVTFEVVAYNGASYANSAVRGKSGSFIEVSAPANVGLGTPATGVVPAGNPSNEFANMPNFQVFAVPEPTTIAIAGLGMAGLLALRRRK